MRYYGYYSNKSRGLRAKRVGEKAAENQVAGVQIIDVSDDQPRRGASKKWRELIKKVWEVDPLICPKCQGEMKMITLIDDAAVVARILKHMGLWPKSEPVRPQWWPERGPPVMDEPTRVDYEHYFSDPMPDYDTCEACQDEGMAISSEPARNATHSAAGG